MASTAVLVSLVTFGERSLIDTPLDFMGRGDKNICGPNTGFFKNSNVAKPTCVTELERLGANEEGS